MADVCEVTPEMVREFEEWKSGRPEVIVDLANRFPPWKLFRMSPTGQRVTVSSYSESGTLTVLVSGRFNRVIFGRSVFGISPDELEECDLPTPGEDVGDTAAAAGYTDDDVRNILIPELKSRGAFGGGCGHPACDGSGHDHN